LARTGLTNKHGSHVRTIGPLASKWPQRLAAKNFESSQRLYLHGDGSRRHDTDLAMTPSDFRQFLCSMAAWCSVRELDDWYRWDYVLITFVYQMWLHMW